MRVIESLGCENREMLLAAKDKHGGDVGVAKILSEDDKKEEENSRKTAALFSEFVFHSSGCTNDDSLGKEDIYIDFGDDAPNKISYELEKSINEASEAGMTDRSANKLRNLNKKISSVFKLRLGSGGPAKFPPMKIILDKSTRPVKVKVGRYTVQQR